MVKKQNILCLCLFIMNNFLTHFTRMRNVRNGRYTYDTVLSQILTLKLVSDFCIGVTNLCCAFRFLKTCS